MFEEDIFKEMMRMQRDMDRMFGEAFSKERPLLGLGQKGASLVPFKEQNKLSWFKAPHCDICETETSVIASIELPGVEKKDIDLQIKDNSIEVKVENKKQTQKKSNDSFSFNSSSQSYYRKIPLNTEVDSSKAKATYKNGLIRLEIPKSRSVKSRRIEIE